MAKAKRRLSKQEIMATRTYIAEGSDPPLRIVVRMGRPRKKREEERYECPVEIIGWGRTRLRPVNGSDVFEAVQLGLILIGTELKRFCERTGHVLKWSGGSRTDIAFPVYPDYSLVPIMDRDARETTRTSESG